MSKCVVGWYSTLFAVVACSGPTALTCTDENHAGLAVYVENSITRVGIASGASLVAQEGAYKDSVAAPDARPDIDASPLFAAAERAGTYQVTVTKAGYAPWTQSNVRVTANVCHVNTVTLTALLQPSS
jgi:hypothetical protein